MSVILTDMEMPRGCYTCKLKSICEYGNANEWLFEKRADECPLCEERKTGKWILLDECSNSGYYCSNCQKKLVKEGWSNTVKKIKFCPNCGAKMEGDLNE